MFRPLFFFIGLRYARVKRKNYFISFISMISIIGLALGVSVLIIVMSVMNGFDRELRSKILGMVPHAAVMSYEEGLDDWQDIIKKASSVNGIVSAAPFIRGQGMLAKGKNVHGTMVYGVDPNFEKKVSIIENNMQQGSIDTLLPGQFNIILSEWVADSMNLKIGDKLTIILPDAHINLAGVFPRLKRFTLSGIFSTGSNVDYSLCYINLQDASVFFKVPQGAEGIRLKMDDLFKAPYIAWHFTSSYGHQLRVEDWTQTQGNLFQAVQMEKRMVGLLLVLIVAVAAFNIVSTLIMMVTDKRKDIAILRTMGMSPKIVMGIFIVQGSIVGVIGSVIGVVLGILGAINVSYIVSSLEKILGIYFLDPDVYFISYLPSDLHYEDVFYISVVSLSLSFIATIYPAWKASKTEPAEALRYE